jgi:hypothetical protein
MSSAANTAGSHVGKVSMFLGIISTVVTLALTALNAFWSHEIGKTDQRLKLEAAKLEEKKIEIDRQNLAITEGKERIARFAFVQNLFGAVLNEKDPGQRTLAINLINLTLTESEATKLFAGLQTSQDKRAQEVGNIGSDLVGITNLVVQVDAAAKQSRLGAVSTLIKNYSGDSRAVEQMLSLLEAPKSVELSSSGRINALVFLRNTDRSAWTPALLLRAEKILAPMLGNESTNIPGFGEQTRDAALRLSDHLANVRKH